MARHHMTANGPVPFTPEEEIEWDEREAKVLSEEPERKAQEVRIERNRLLQETDWVVIRSAEVNDSVSSSWIAYRQALRDITAQEGFPHTITWPVKP